MTRPIEQHQIEIRRNDEAWRRKPLLRRLYHGFYDRILALIDPTIPGAIVEIGSGIGNLKERLPEAIATDLFRHAWLDLVCDGYHLPFAAGRVSHLILFDVFHHLETPSAFLREARRVLAPGGRVILVDPYISLTSYPFYEWLHHETVGGAAIDFGDTPPPSRYYAAQGNATRLFFRRERPDWPEGWRVIRARASAEFSYLLSGGFSRPSIYPARWLGAVRRADSFFSRWPRLFGARCLVALTPDG